MHSFLLFFLFLPEWRQALDRAIQLMHTGSAQTEPAFRDATSKAAAIGDGGMAKAIVSTYFSLVLVRQERYAEAEPMLLESLSVFERNPEQAPGEHIAALNNMAYLLHQTGRREAEVQYLSDAAQQAESMRPVDAVILVPILGNLAMLYVERGDFANARVILERARAHETDPRVAQHRFRMPLLNAASEYHLERGELREAREKAALSLRIAEQSNEGESAELPGPLHQLARVELAMGHLSAAERHWKRGLEILRQHRSRDYPQLASILMPLASLARVQGRGEESEQMLREAARIAELSKRTSVLAVVQHELALLQASRKRYAQAESLYRSSLALTASFIGTRNSEYASCSSDFAVTLASMGKYAEAERVLREAIVTTEQIRAVPDPALAGLLHGHAKLLLKLKRKDEAKQVEARAQALRDSGAVGALGQTVDVLELK
ncbi:MAG: tetratricopeptide repeat protein [Acidobacteria bacterium]|nr:tetratricopeptide repeat protein [Acidobacteriota bacterium]